jgi:hypothetical protein
MLETDTGLMLKKADKALNHIQLKLQTVLSNGDYHKVIHANIPDQTVEVFEDQFIYAKIPINGSYSPCYIQFEYEKRA